MAGSTYFLVPIPLSSTRYPTEKVYVGNCAEKLESGRYKFRKGYAMFVRIAGKALFIGLDESDKISKVSV
jgi:hypothetical protein